MNNFQSRVDIHVELEYLNVEAVKLAVNIKENFEELRV